MAIRWAQTPEIQLRIISFKVFKHLAVSNDKGLLDTEVLGLQIIYGGPEFMVDLVEDGTFQNRPQEMKYVSRLEELSKRYSVWLPPHQVLFFRKKTEYIRILDTIAMSITLTTCPRTEVLCRLSQFIETTVLKHEGLNNSKCRVYYSAEAVARVQEMYGKWQAYVLANQVVSVIRMAPSVSGRGTEWHIKDCRNLYPLDKLSSAVLAEGDPHNVLIRSYCDFREQVAAMKTFEAFVKQTLEALIVESGESLGDQVEVVMGTLLTTLIEQYEHTNMSSSFCELLITYHPTENSANLQRRPFHRPLHWGGKNGLELRELRTMRGIWTPQQFVPSARLHQMRPRAALGSLLHDGPVQVIRRRGDDCSIVVVEDKEEMVGRDSGQRGGWLMSAQARSQKQRWWGEQRRGGATSSSTVAKAMGVQKLGDEGERGGKGNGEGGGGVRNARVVASARMGRRARAQRKDESEAGQHCRHAALTQTGLRTTRASTACRAWARAVVQRGIVDANAGEGGEGGVVEMDVGEGRRGRVANVNTEREARAAEVHRREGRGQRGSAHRGQGWWSCAETGEGGGSTTVASLTSTWVRAVSGAWAVGAGSIVDVNAGVVDVNVGVGGVRGSGTAEVDETGAGRRGVGAGVGQRAQRGAGGGREPVVNTDLRHPSGGYREDAVLQ
ncbi:hypothetical protein B0H13DRAFT_1866308 [Mycena leptocephala]|nr:hypothetical protein B0H13DRAFT_1866308 [Mycena leptocephala]